MGKKQQKPETGDSWPFWAQMHILAMLIMSSFDAVLWEFVAGFLSLNALSKNLFIIFLQILLVAVPVVKNLGGSSLPPPY